MKRATAVLVTLLLAGAQTSMWAQTGAIEIRQIEARGFLAHTGQMSAPIDERTALWNVSVSGGDLESPSTSTLVTVLVVGPPRVSGGRRVVTLSVTKASSRAKPELHRQPLGIFSEAGQFYAAFWLRGTGCDELNLVATLSGSSKSVGKRLAFRCGE
jgi:hypothetical protein